MDFSQCCNSPKKNKLIHKYKTEGVAQLKNIQKLGNNHVNFKKKKKFFFFILLIIL